MLQTLIYAFSCQDNSVRNKTIIKNLFKGKAFQYIWLVKLLEIVPSLIFKDIKKNTDSEGGWIIVLSNKSGNTIEFTTSEDENDLDYGDILGIWSTSYEDLLDEIEMKGTFFCGPTNFKYNNQAHINQLKKSLNKFANLK